jgi:hypothetical protein
LSETRREYPPLVRCQLENVSLDDFAHKYLSFLEGSKEGSRTADLYLIWTKSLLDQWPNEYPDGLANKELERWIWEDYLRYPNCGRWHESQGDHSQWIRSQRLGKPESRSSRNVNSWKYIQNMGRCSLHQSNDLHGRAREVNIMEDVYRGVSKVIAWLGLKT